MRDATRRFVAAVTSTDPVEPPPGPARETLLRVHPLHDAEVGRHECRPAVTRLYESSDPYHELNPCLVWATTDLIERTMAITRDLESSDDASLAYLDVRRARKRPTVVTRTLAECDPGLGAWMKRLPAAECLQPAAHPWTDAGMLIWDGDAQRVREIAPTPALRALTGASNDGRAVRERAAWERMIVAAQVGERDLQGDTLRIVSLGTGTGEPALDAGLAAMRDGAERVEVLGVDIDPDSLRIAEHLAHCKQALADPGALRFTACRANLLQEKHLARVVREGAAHLYEAIGFAEYVPSGNTTDPTERHMRERMARLGMLSAEGFYRTIYEHMPYGSTLLTGNMRDDSPHGRFVTSGIGWPSLILRSTERLVGVLGAAGIPGDAIRLYLPGPGSAGVYNLVTVTKS